MLRRLVSVSGQEAKIAVRDIVHRSRVPEYRRPAKYPELPRVIHEGNPFFMDFLQLVEPGKGWPCSWQAAQVGMQQFNRLLVLFISAVRAEDIREVPGLIDLFDE